LKQMTFATPVIPGSVLEPGSYAFWFEGGTISTLVLDPEREATLVSIAQMTWGDPVSVAGTVLPGATLTALGAAIPTAGDRRFAARLAPRDGLALRAEHPHHGIHYYLLSDPARGRQVTVGTAAPDRADSPGDTKTKKCDAEELKEQGMWH